MSTQRIKGRVNDFSDAAVTTMGQVRKRGNGSKSRHHEQVEKALLESEEKYRNLFENARDMIILVDTETGIILDVNTAGCNLLGLPKKKIVGMHQSKLHPPELADKFNRLFQAHAQRGGHVTDYVVIQGIDGAEIPMDVSASVVKLADKTIIQGIFRDVTERAKIEKALKESEEKFSKIFQSSPDAIGIVTEKDGKFIDVNESYIRMTGFSREDLIGTTTNTHNWLKPEDHAKMQKLLKEHGRIYNEEFDYITKSGEIRTRLFSIEPITINGELCRIGVSTDITDRKRAEEALQKEKAFLSSILTSIQDGVTVLDKKLNIISANKTAEEWFAHGMPLIGKKCYQACHNRSKPCEDCPTIRTLETGKAADRVVPRHSSDGTVTGWSELYTFPIFDTQTGEITSVIEYGRDVTARRRAEQALRESEKKFSQAFQAMPEEVTIVRIKDDTFIDVNETFCRNNGYTREEIIGHKGKELNLAIKSDEWSRVIKMVKEQGRADNIDLEFRDESDEIHTLLFSSEIIDLGGEPCLLTIGKDITERKRMEQALKESEEKFSKSFRALPEQVTIVRMRDGVFIDVNESFCRYNGYAREEVIGHKREELNLLIGQSQREQIAEKTKERGRFKNIELECRDKTGKTRTLLFSAEIINIGGEPCQLTIANDITERKRMEQALKESEEKFSRVFHASPDAVSLVTVEDEMYIDVNDSYTKMTGYSREELTGNTAYSINLWVNDENHNKMRQMMQEQGRIYDQEFEYRTKSGEIRTRLFSLEPITINGEPCTLGVSTDITERKRMEQALKESEEKFSKSFHASPEAIGIVTEKDGKFIDVNESYARMTGYSREELIGNKAHITLQVNPDDPIIINKMLQEKGRIYDQEFDFRTKSGEIRTRLLSVEPITINGEPCRISVSTDITERKRIEQALKESEEKFSKAFQSLPESVFIIRMKDNMFVDVNESFCRGSGYPREKVIGHKAAELNLAIEPSQWNQITKILKEKGRAENIEIEFRDKSGEMHTELFSSDIINLGGEPCILTIGKDITGRKKMEQALRESEEKFSKAFRASPEAMGIVREKDGRFIDLNDSYEQMTGYSREELLGFTTETDTWVSPENKMKVDKMLKEKGRIHNEEIDYRTKSGEIRTRLLSLEPITINGEPCRIGVSTDITERKRMEKKLKETLADLESSSAKLKATNKELESFSYSVSHDLRSPLRSIDGFSQALLEDYSAKLDEKGQDYLSRMRNASQKMGELIDGLLKLSRLTRSEMHHEKVDLSSLANEIAARLQETNPERNVKFIIGSDLKATGDLQMLRVLLENLLGNAFKFTKNTEQALIEFGSINEGEGKTFFIRDNGAGFDMAFNNKLFSAFQRLHDAAEYPGTGIGLATVQRIINRHGGSVRAEGEVGKGATFYFTLS